MKIYYNLVVSKNVRKLKIDRNIINLNISFLIIVSKKVMSNLYMLGLTMLICILGHMNNTSVITKYFDIVIMQIIVNESMFHPKDLCTTSPGGNMLDPRGGE